MADIKDMYQSADWKTEKHVPVIEAPATVKADKPTKIVVSVGKEIPHPNKTEHHIEWIEAYFLPEGEKFPYMVGRAEFTSHGASAKGPDTSTVYSHPEAVFTLITGKSGTIMAVSSCNIHGLWQDKTEIKVE
ncbi:MAG: class II SORL domain-containing protein [Candidatus Thermoplasmatota archaeon]|nr:class II SORL domain-containing protein [Candidatus Thermoplasmatota archaeon]